MPPESWQTKSLAVANLHLDEKNPRLGRETQSRAPREIVQYLFDHDKALEVAESIGRRGFFPNEPLLAIREKDKHVVVEGNRRLAALKALKEPGLLEGPKQRAVERLSRNLYEANSLMKVPVVVAPNRRATDRILAGRHVGTPVLSWQAENRASFILEKLEEGYDNERLLDDLGFTTSDIQNARLTRAVAEMARSLDLPDEIGAKLDNPRAQIFSTIERVLVSSEGRKVLMIEPDVDHGIRGKTTKKEFSKGFTKLVTDVALGHQTSRTLNKGEDIKTYLGGWSKGDKPVKKRGSFVPADVIGKDSAASSRSKPEKKPKQSKPKTALKTVLPSNLKIRHGNERMIDIRKELIKLKRDNFPNAGAVLLRVFLEISVLHYLERTGELAKLTKTLKDKGKLRHGTPNLGDLTPTIVRIAKKKLTQPDARRVEKALRRDAAAPFSLSDLHTFVHQAGDLPSARDIQQFWLRTEPLFRLMIEQEEEEL